MNDNIIAAGIVLYNPDLQRLEENITAIIGQVSNLILIDNNSDNIAGIQRIQSKYSNSLLVRNTKNEGIAFALNQIVKEVNKLKAVWAITLDQDSVAPGNMVSEYVKYIDKKDVGLITCLIDDRNVGRAKTDTGVIEPITEVNSCITSGSMLNVNTAFKVGGFDERFFIDIVDFDFCKRIRLSGYKILRVNAVSLLHEVGHSTKKRFLGKEIVVFNHSPLRNYYRTRNRILYGRKYGELLTSFKKTSRRFFWVLLFEKNKIKNFAFIIKAYFDGLTMKL